jgi:hypothetical protein
MATEPINTPPAVGINPNIPVPVQRDLRKLFQMVLQAQGNATSALAGLGTRVPGDLNSVSKYVSEQLQAGGQFPLPLTALSGGNPIIPGPGIKVVVVGTQIQISLVPFGPGAGTYTTGAKLTGGGTAGTITIDAYGRVSAISPAT